MSIFYVLLLGLAVSIDGFVAGIAYGLKNIRMPFASLCIVGVVASICTAIALAMAYMVGQFINTAIAIGIGAFLLIMLGIWSLFQQYFTKDVASYEIDGEVTARNLTFSLGRLVISIMAKPETADVDRLGYISSLEAIFLGLAVGADAMVGTFAAALMGPLPLYTPIVIGIIHMVCIASGYYSSQKFFPEKLKKRFPYLPGTLLILLGLIRLG
ncbi:putative sporulation protein YtaF [Sporomusa rhizae]|uniref:manganese efflux pump n=1 Tax=Sporomusa rhizae TaxID=357999 RepID=UPI00352B3497